MYLFSLFHTDVFFHVECGAILPGATSAKELASQWETLVQSLGGEDPLGQGIATHSRILAWGIPMDQRAWRATYACKESNPTEHTRTPYFG